MKLALLNVPYIKTNEHFELAKNSYESFPDVYSVAVVNHVRGAHDEDLINAYNSKVLRNSANNLARAWNIGLRHIFEEGYDMALVPNLDVRLKPESLDKLLDVMDDHPNQGVYSMTAVNSLTTFKIVNSNDLTNEGIPIKNHDQSFSCFLIERWAFEHWVGEFYEGFGVYYEDNDYLHRCKMAGLTPMRSTGAIFYHHIQGTVKNGTHADFEAYLKRLEESKQHYIKRWGNEPGFERYEEPLT